MTKTKHIAFFAFAVIAIAGSGLVAAQPFWTNTEQRTAMDTALESNDFTSWKTIMENQITEENFNKMSERHNQMKNMKGNMEQVRAAIEAGDYNAWYTAMTKNGRNPQVLEKINKDNFATFVDMHKAMQSGDTETAKTLAEQLGIGPGLGIKKMNGHGMHGQGMYKQGCPFAE